MGNPVATISFSAELGDFDAKLHNAAFVSEFRFVPVQTEDMENQILAVYSTLVGRSKHSLLDKGTSLSYQTLPSFPNILTHLVPSRVMVKIEAWLRITMSSGLVINLHLHPV